LRTATALRGSFATDQLKLYTLANTNTNPNTTNPITIMSTKHNLTPLT